MGVQMSFHTNTPLSPFFLPNLGDLFLVGLGIKHLSPTKIHPPFPFQQNNLKNSFLLSILSPIFHPPIITPTKHIVNDGQHKFGQLRNDNPYSTNLALTYTSFNLYSLKYTFSCCTLIRQKFSFNKQNKVISRSFNMTNHTKSDMLQWSLVTRVSMAKLLSNSIRNISLGTHICLERFIGQLDSNV